MIEGFFYHQLSDYPLLGFFRRVRQGQTVPFLLMSTMQLSHCPPDTTSGTDLFERPQKNDLDTELSMLMHESRHKLIEDVSRIKSDAIKAGSLSGNRVIVTAVKAADGVHKAAMEQANTILLDFIERTARPPTEIVGWARPHLENLNNSVLGLVPPNGFPQDHQRLTHQYRGVFQQRLDIMLRKVELGHQRGAGFARAEKVENKEEWISAAAAVRLLTPDGKSELSAKMALCKRAHAGMVRSRAERFIVAGRARDNVELPPVFWWAEGHAALSQDWRTGDFDTWPESSILSGDLRLSAGKVHLEAFNVSFMRSGVDKMIPANAVAPVAATSIPAASSSGRPPADWWEDCLIDLCFKHFRGEPPHKTQADIGRAMQDWIAEHGYDAAESTIKLRARKLMLAIKRDGAAER